MDLRDETGTEARFRAYAADLALVLGHADRVRPFEDYCVGLLSAEGRKSVEPLAAVTAPERTAAQHQSLLHLVAQAPWSDQAVLSRVRERVVPSITRDEPIQAWIIDDTGFPKKGRHSVGVARHCRARLPALPVCRYATRHGVSGWREHAARGPRRRPATLPRPEPAGSLVPRLPAPLPAPCHSA